jgi:hypothetical protein
MIDTKTLALAGNATFTITSKRTGTRFTYKIRKPKPETPHFVKVLSGPNNEEDFRFLGTIFDGKVFRTSPKSGISPQAPSVIAFNWLWNHIDNIPADKVVVHHEGRCCRCGRKLTVPSSIDSNIGPECAKYFGTF